MNYNKLTKKELIARLEQLENRLAGRTSTEHKKLVSDSSINDLIERASDILNSEGLVDLDDKGSIDLADALHNIEVYQVELEIQNEELRSTNEELEKLKQRYTELYENAPAGYVSFDMSGSIKSINKTALDMTGYSETELHNRSINKLIAGAHHKNFYSHLKDIINTKKEHSIDLKIIRKDRSEFFARFQSIAFFDNFANFIEYRTILFDRTESIRIENELKESEQKHKLVSGLISDYLYSAAIDSEGYTHTEWIYGAFKDITGYSLEEMKELPGGFEGIFYPGDAERIDKLREKIQEGLPIIFEYRIYSKNDGVKWIRDYIKPLPDAETGRVTGVLGAVQDVTDLKEEENALKESELKYRMLAENLLQGITIVQNDRFIYSNRRHAEIIGIPQNELKTRKLSDLFNLIHPGDRESILKDLQERMSGNYSKDKSMFRIVTPAGELKWVETDVVSYEYKGETAYQYVFTDITERKKAETNLRELLNFKDKIFSIIAHDLRNPFNAFLAYAKYLNQTEDISQNKLNDISNKLYTSAKSLFILLENLLDWSHLQTHNINFNPETLKLNEIFDEVKSSVEYWADNKNLTILKDIPDDIQIFADRYMLLTVLRNILSNAIKFSYRGGKISVSAENKGDITLIHIKDEGTGIQPEILDKLFKPNVHITKKGTEDEEGTGLGLNVSKNFTEMNKGDITVESVPNKSTIFTITLPASD